MNIQPIRTEADHQTALNEIAGLMVADPELGTPKGDRLDVLATLVEAYERAHFPIEPADPWRRSGSAWNSRASPPATSCP